MYVIFSGKFVDPAPISLKPSLRLHFDNIWTGTYCTFARVADKDDIYVFGLNNFNQIGDLSVFCCQCMFQIIYIFIYLGLDITEPEYLPKKSKDFSKYKWEHISGGQHHTLGLATGGKVYAIGRKEYGRLGLGEFYYTFDFTIFKFYMHMHRRKLWGRNGIDRS